MSRGERRPYPAELRQALVELVRSGRTPEALARDYAPSAQTIRLWVAQAERNAGERGDGLTTAERAELRRLRRANAALRTDAAIAAAATAWFALANPAETQLEATEAPPASSRA